MFYFSRKSYNYQMEEVQRAQWTFLSNHGHALIYLAQHPDARLRDIAESVGITERFAHSIVSDLISAGYVSSERQGRRNTYVVNESLSFRHPLERSAQVGRLIEIFPNLDQETPHDKL